VSTKLNILTDILNDLDLTMEINYWKNVLIMVVKSLRYFSVLVIKW